MRRIGEADGSGIDDPSGTWGGDFYVDDALERVQTRLGLVGGGVSNPSLLGLDTRRGWSPDGRISLDGRTDGSARPDDQLVALLEHLRTQLLDAADTTPDGGER